MHIPRVRHCRCQVSFPPRDAAKQLRAAHAALATVVLLLAGCRYPGEPICTDVAIPGIIVDVVSATSENALTGASGVIREGDYVEPLDTFGSQLYGAYERTGTYDLEVTAEGYVPWQRQGIRVTADRCHVRTNRIEARLQPSS